MRDYVCQPDLNLARFFLLNHFQAGLPTELRRVLNLQNKDELRLNAAVKLATIKARSREEAKCASKVYATEVIVEDTEDTQIEAVLTKFSPIKLVSTTSAQQPKPTTAFSKSKSKQVLETECRQQLQPERTDLHFLQNAGPPTGGMPQKDVG